MRLPCELNIRVRILHGSDISYGMVTLSFTPMDVVGEIISFTNSFSKGSKIIERGYCMKYGSGLFLESEEALPALSSALTYNLNGVGIYMLVLMACCPLYIVVLPLKDTSDNPEYTPFIFRSSTAIRLYLFVMSLLVLCKKSVL